MPNPTLLGQAEAVAAPVAPSRFTADESRADGEPVGGVSIEGYTAADWPAVRDFVAQHWRSDHPLTDRGLFSWQYRGFGHRVGTQSIRLIRVGSELVGFLGLIPGAYFCDGRSVDGAAIALWVVRPDLRDRGLGVLALREVRATHGLICCVGIAPAALPLYQKLGYSHTQSLMRWVAVLERDGAAGVMRGAADARAFDLGEMIEPAEAWGFERLAALYQRTVMTQFRAGLSRSVAFWRWRYAGSAGFAYRVFESEGGFVIARVERVIAPEVPAADRRGVLRLIEILPATAGAWDGACAPDSVRLVRGVLAWGASRGCVLADFQHCSARLDPLLQAAGLTPVSAKATWTQTVPNLFQPLRASAAPLNAVWSVSGSTPIGADDLYLVKSDGDMDRPNVWPLALEYLD